MDYLKSALLETIPSQLPLVEKLWLEVLNFSEKSTCFDNRHYHIIRLDKTKIIVQEVQPVSTLATKVAIVIATLLIFPLIFCVALKLIHRCLLPSPTIELVYHQNVGVASPSRVEPENSLLNQRKTLFNRVRFAEKAFVCPNRVATIVPGKVEMNDAHTIAILNQYPNLKKMKHHDTLSADQKIIIRSHGGFITLPHLNEEIKATLHVILKSLEPSSTLPQFKKNSIAKRLGEAFISCEQVQYRVCKALNDELTGNGTLNQAILHYWQLYKDSKLDELIYRKHPDCDKADGRTNPQNQFPHLKSGYLVLIGHTLGLENVDVAAKDIKRKQWYLNIDAFKERTIEEYKQMLSIQEFAEWIEHDINHAAAADKIIASDLIHPYSLSENIKKFGYYDASKSYAGIDQEDSEERKEAWQNCLVPFISYDEIIEILDKLKISKSM